MEQRPTIPALLRLTFVAAAVLLSETVFFHMLLFVRDYYTATLVISIAVLGIGFSAIAAHRLPWPSGRLFAASCLVGAIALLASFACLAFHASLWLLGPMLALTFCAPVVFVARAFAENPGRQAYFFDMVGAGAGVLVAELLYRLIGSEAIVLLLAAALSLAGLVASLRHGGRLAPCLGALLLGGCTVALYAHIRHDSLNLFRIIRPDKGLHDPHKCFIFYPKDSLRATYDSLVGRLDVVWRDGDFGVNYNGDPNDHFTDNPSLTHDYFEREGIDEPTDDVRVPYGAVAKPRVFVLGSSAQGIIKTIKEITPLDRITSAEINPGILRCMREDFFEESGRAYEGIEPAHGNGLSMLRSTRDRYDMITLINTHSTRSISHLGAPDYLHTLESYGTFFDRLTDRGYLVIEERLMNRRGVLGFYRMVNTLWQALARRGVEDPTAHFVIWEWMGTGMTDFKPHHMRAYVSMLVTREPIEGEFAEALRPAVDRVIGRTRGPTRLAFQKGRGSTRQYAELFQMIESRDFSPLAKEGFDSSPITADRPFASASRRTIPQLDRMLVIAAALTLLAGTLLGTTALRDSPTPIRAGLMAFNALIGAGYFLIEIVIILTYQTVFVSPSVSLVYVLGLLLISSAVGGLLASQWDIRASTVALASMCAVALAAPPTLMAADMAPWLTKSIAIGCVAGTGALMGVYFPRGLAIARSAGAGQWIPHLFAINGIAGSFAVVLALYLGVKIGYRWTAAIALACYALAAIVAQTMILRRER